MHSSGIQIIVRKMVQVLYTQTDNIAHTRPTALIFLYSYTYLRKEGAWCWRKSEITATENTAFSCGVGGECGRLG